MKKQARNHVNRRLSESDGAPANRDGFGGGGGGSTLVDPGVYMVRLSIADKTYSSSVQVLEDIWQRVQ